LTKSVKNLFPNNRRERQFPVGVGGGGAGGGGGGDGKNCFGKGWGGGGGGAPHPLNFLLIPKSKKLGMVLLLAPRGPRAGEGAIRGGQTVGGNGVGTQGVRRGGVRGTTPLNNNGERRRWGRLGAGGGNSGRVGDLEQGPFSGFFLRGELWGGGGGGDGGRVGGDGALGGTDFRGVVGQGAEGETIGAGSFS